MKYRDPTTGDFKELKIRATDELPVGSEIDVADNTTIPAGWEQTEELNTYSTEEQRIGTWIDGKPLYRKTLVYNGAVTGANYIDLTSLNYEFIVIKEASFIRSNFIFSPVRYNAQSANDLIEVFIDNTQKKMNINIGSAWNNTNCYVTIQYTKTTD